MDKFRTEFQDDIKKAHPEIKDPQERRVRTQAIATWLFNTDHIRVQYGITYDGTSIERLSPGTRGIVLLLYLAVDTHDLRPLFIDQPEENLDQRSVFTELVPHYRSAERRRQVIMVTHNANLVVNTDADQIIVASCENSVDGGLPTITYTSVASKIRRFGRMYAASWKGGRRAFLDRERRHRIRSGDVAVDDEA